MRTTTISFNLRAWRDRLGLTQPEAAPLLGLSRSGYVTAELRNSRRPDNPCNATLAYLCMYREYYQDWRKVAACITS